MIHIAFTLKVYTGVQVGDFYIQSRGLHAGRPLRKPIPNCFAVFTEHEQLYFLVYVLYKGRIFEPYIHGTAVPLIRITDVKKLIETNINIYNTKTQKMFEAVSGIDKLILVEQGKVKTLQQLQYAYCREIIGCEPL